jgi:hypothetical protein
MPGDRACDCAERQPDPLPLALAASLTDDEPEAPQPSIRTVACLDDKAAPPQGAEPKRDEPRGHCGVNR